MSDATETVGVDAVAPAPIAEPEPSGRPEERDPPPRIGPFTVRRRLSAGPGAHLYAATDQDGAPRLLQVVRLRPATDEADADARAEEERRVARGTAQLLGRPGVEVHAHGGADGDDGSRLLFWALPADDAVRILADIPASDVGGLLELARGLGVQLADRHHRGLATPLLSEHHVGIDASGAPRILGVPVCVDDEWLEAPFEGSRRAPEEEGDVITEGGDVFRLGRLLEARSVALSLPEGVARFVESLVRAEPSRRPASGAEILGDLDGLLASEPDLMGVPEEPDPGLFPTEEVTQSASVQQLMPSGGTDPLAVTTWGAPEWTEVEANATPIAPQDLPQVLDPDDAPTRAETAIDPSAPAATPTDPAASVAAAASWQTDPAAAHTARPEPVTDEARHEALDPMLSESDAPTAQAVAEPPSSPDLEVLTPEDVAARAAEAEVAPAEPAPVEETVEAQGEEASVDAAAAVAVAAAEAAEASESEPASADADPAAEASAPELDTSGPEPVPAPEATDDAAPSKGEAVVEASAPSVAEAAAEVPSDEPPEVAKAEVSAAPEDPAGAVTLSDEPPEGSKAEVSAAPEDSAGAVTLSDEPPEDAKAEASAAPEDSAGGVTLSDEPPEVAKAEASAAPADSAGATTLSDAPPEVAKDEASAAPADSAGATTLTDAPEAAKEAPPSGEVGEAEASAAPSDASSATPPADEIQLADAAAPVEASPPDSPEAAEASAPPSHDEDDLPDASSDAIELEAADGVAPASKDEPEAAADAAPSEPEAPSTSAADVEASPAPETEEPASPSAAALLAAAPSAPTDPGTHAEDAASTDRARPDAVAPADPAPRDSAVAVRSTEETEAPAEGRVPVEAIAAGWDQPVLPAGESPWSEVISPRGAHRRDHSAFPGFEEDFPTEQTSNPPAPTSNPPAAVVYDDEPASAEEIAAAVSGFDPRKLVGGVLAILVIFGVFALIARTGADRSRDGKPTVVPPGNEFVLDTVPPGAWVVARADGRTLGKTPMSFLVPPGGGGRIFLVMAGHEPLALDLLERGGLQARLEPTSDEVCEVTLEARAGIQLETATGAPVSRGRIGVPGSLVVRAKADEERVGARLLRCPNRGGEPVARLELAARSVGASVRITEPAGAAAYLDGEPVGRVPTVARADRAVVEVRIDDASGMSVSRWVPTDGPTEIRMPGPKARRRPRLVVPDTRPGDADVLAGGEAVEAPPKKRSAAVRRRIARLIRAGSRHLKAGRTRRASRSYRECLRIEPNEPVCHRGLGHLYRRIGKLDKAKVYYQRYLELSPDASDAARISRLVEE